MSTVRDALAAKAFMDRIRQLFTEAQQPAEHPSAVTRRELRIGLALDDLEDELKRMLHQLRAWRH